MLIKTSKAVIALPTRREMIRYGIGAAAFAKMSQAQGMLQAINNETHPTTAWDKGFNFRQTSGWVTDGANETYVLADSYPTTRNGVTFGWEQTVTTADRNASVDRRLAGINYQFNDGTGMNFRVDLPSTGSYSIRLALGDEASGQTNNSGIVKDNTTTLITILHNTGIHEWYDAQDVAQGTAATWVSSNSPSTQTFSSTIFRLLIGSPASGVSTISHIFISKQ